MMRITKVNECGAPIYGDCSQVVSKGFVSVEFQPQTDDGDDITVRNAAGDICVSVPSCKRVTGIDVTINFCSVDTDMFAMMTGRDPITNDQGENIGFDIGDMPCAAGFALELWTGVFSETACDGTTGKARYGYLVLPWISGGVLNDFTVENDALTFGVTGTARTGSGWGEGPYDVQDHAGGAAPLHPGLDPDMFGRMLLTTVPPPEDECGCQPLGDRQHSGGEHGEDDGEHHGAPGGGEGEDALPIAA
ncbi:hypothetical protein [Amycolatopsis sp. DSM 110486]|uniref:hypothetical protein n=1 Tax=Amycolatopsis sp. DSM 110486 TaxID=2865832 RepID=UPI001C695044|nr:hypothetical protein [Amycolatopsis sp. DSM 110486]QYN17603.1 hypothetical protein K1T34_32990 [Amycolatopsis sp. DSM 110486]